MEQKTTKDGETIAMRAPARCNPSRDEACERQAFRSVRCASRMRRQIAAVMRAALPAEGVAALFGWRCGSVLHVLHMLPLHNLRQSPDRFEVTPAAFAAALAGCPPTATFLGFAHSHPTGTVALSPTDRQALWPHCLHAIFAPVGNRWQAAFYWHDGEQFAVLPRSGTDARAAKVTATKSTACDQQDPEPHRDS